MINRVFRLRNFIPTVALLLLILTPCHASAWTVSGVDSQYPSVIHWDAVEHGVVAEYSYMKINGTFYNVDFSDNCDGTWCPAGMVFADLAQCNQNDGRPLRDPYNLPNWLMADMTGMEGQPIEHFATWPGNQVLLTINNTYEGWPGIRSIIDWPYTLQDQLMGSGYLKISGTFYKKVFSDYCDGEFCPLYNVFADLAHCNQITGEVIMDDTLAPVPVPAPADMTGMEGTAFEYYTSWPGNNVTWTINNIYEGWPGFYSIIDWPFNMHDVLLEGGYLKIQDIYYYITYSDNCDGYWCPSGMVFADLANCNQITGEVIMDDTLAPVPVPSPANLTGMEWEPLELYTSIPPFVFPVSPSTYLQYDADINDLGEVVWVEEDYLGIRQVFSNQRGQITFDSFNHSQARINNYGEIFWVQEEDALGNTDNIYTSIRGRLTADQTNHVDIDINDRGDVVWMEFDTYNINHRIMGIIISSLTEVSIDSAADCKAPSINDLGEVVWEQYDINTFTQHIFSNTRGQLTFGAAGINFAPLIDNSGNVYFASWENDTSTQNIYRIIAGQLTQLTFEDWELSFSFNVNNQGEAVWSGLDPVTRLYQVVSTVRGKLLANMAIFNQQLNNCGDLVFNTTSDEGVIYLFGRGDACIVPIIVDADQDGFNAGADCLDSDPAVYPGAPETPYNFVDENCNGFGDDDDLDNDGYGIVEDCNDDDPLINPAAAEIVYNGIDENCNGMVDDDDLDNDGYPIASDCNDDDPLINPSAAEIAYNGIDENCNGFGDDDDLDNDGYPIATDCDDDDPLINPGVAETPYNGIDENCNGIGDDDDLDNDGFLNAEECNDLDATINPDQCDIRNDGIDQDCDGADRTSGKPCAGDGGGEDPPTTEPEGKGRTCSDGIDNDGDGFADCNDTDCSENKSCK